jgi:polar amino acid transport system substrate-binding protein
MDQAIVRAHSNDQRSPMGLATWIAVIMLCLAVFASDVFAGQGLNQVRQRGRLIWGADREGGGPFVYPDPANPNNLIGFEAEIAEQLASRLGVTSQFAQGQWDKLPDLLNRGDIDIVLNGYEWSHDRSVRFGCSLPYYIYQLQLLGRLGKSPVQSFEELIESAGDRKPKIGVLGGSSAHDYLTERYAAQVEIIQFEGAAEVLRGVELGLDGLDANLQDLPVWTFFEKGFPDLAPIGSPVGKGYYVVLTRRDDEELLREVNNAFLGMLTDGTMRKILERYSLWNDVQAARALEMLPNGQFAPTDNQAAQPSDDNSEVKEYESMRGWNVLGQRGLFLVKAAGITVLLAVTAMPLAILAGMLMAVARMFGPRWLAGLVTIVIEVIRGTPLVLQLYVIFFLLPELGLSIHAFWAGVLGLAINYSAYEAEIYRAGIQAVPRGQLEAAKALGMSPTLALRRVILPQATRIVIPPVTNDFIALFKDTAVCSVITVVELSKEYSIHARSTGAIVELGLLTAVLYLAMSYPMSQLAGRLEKRVSRGPA